MTLNNSKLPLGTVYWLTGLSGTGKSTLAPYLVAHLRGLDRPVVQLDGDELRKILGQSTDYSRQARIEIGIKYFQLCNVASSQGIDVVIAAIGLYRELQDWVTKNIPNCHILFIDTPMSELERRDTKGLYAQARRGEIHDVAGVDMAVDFPSSPSVHLQWVHGKGIDNMVGEMLHALQQLNDKD